MLILADNRQLIKDREKTYLTAAVSAAGTALTVRAVDTNAWADNDYVIIGEIGTRNAELLQVNGAVSDGTALTIDQLGSGGARYAHSVGEPVYRIDYNRVEFNRNTTDTTTGVSVLATNEIQPDDLFTRYEDTTNTTGFGFVRFNNQTSAAFSSYSDGVPYTGYTARSLYRMREKVRRLIREAVGADVEQKFLADEDIRQELNNSQRALSQERLWPFFQRTKSFSGVANQWRYTVNDDVSKMHYVVYDSQPLAVIDKKRFDILNWDASVAGDPTHCVVWKDEDGSNRVFLNIYPKTASAADTDQLNGAISATVTTITVDSTSGFPAKGRIIIDSEVIEYDATTSTTFTGCRRGAEGTTAASHSDDVAITERDFIYHYHADPTDMVDTNDITPVPDPDVLIYGAATELALLLPDPTLHDRLLAKHNVRLEKLRKNFANMQTGGPIRVKKVEEIVTDDGVYINPNNSPRDVTGQN